MSRMLAIASATGLLLCAAFLGLAFFIGGDNVFHDQRSLGRIKPLIDLATRKEWRWEGGDTLALNAPVNVRYEPKGPPGVSVTGPAELMKDVRVGEGRIVSNSTPRRTEQRMEAVISGVPIRKFVVNGRENLDLGHIDQESLDVHLNGVGTVSGEGRVGELNLVIAGPGNADLGKLFVTDDAKVSILGNGTAALSPQGDLRLFIAGNGKLTLLTRPKDLSQTILGRGEVIEPPLPPSPPPPGSVLAPQTRTQTQTSTRTQTDAQDLQTQVQVQVNTGSDLVVRGSHDVDFGHINQDNVKITVLNSGSATAEGKVDTLTVNVMGSGEAHLGKLSARRITVVIAGSGEATLAPGEELKATLMGSGKVHLLTRPGKIERTIMGSGRIIEAP